MPAPSVLPDVELSTLQGLPTHLSAATKHRPAVIALWASWCEACLAEQPALDRLEHAAEPRNGVVIGISVGESIASVRAQLAKHPVGYLQLVDEPFAFADTIGVQRVPTVYVIDAAGRVVHAGASLDHAALSAFRAALGAP